MAHAAEGTGLKIFKSATDLESQLRYPKLFRVGWLLFFAGTPFMGWNSIGLLLVFVHGVLDGRAISALFRAKGASERLGIRLGSGSLVPYLVAGLGASGLVSAALAVQPGRALAALLGFVLTLAFGLVYGTALQRQHPRWFLAYLWPVVPSSIVHAGWALWEVLQTGGRVGAITFTGQNGVGTLMLLGLILGLVWFTSRRDWRRWLAVPYALWVGAALVMTYSRGSWLGLAAFAALAVIPAWRHAGARRYATVALVTGALLFALVVAAVPGAARRAQTFLSLADESRVGIYGASWEMFTDHLWFGVGAANFDNHWETYNRGRVPEAIGFPHNTLLQVLTETGAVGGLFFLLIIVVLLGAVWRNRRTTEWSLWLLAAGFLAMLVRDQVDGAIFNVNVAFVFWWMAGMVLGNEPAEHGTRELVSEQPGGVS